MSLPSVEVVIADVPGAGQSPTSVTTLYAIGYALQGGTEPVRLGSMNRFRSEFGDRDPGSSLHDAASVFFREGGDEMIVQRIFGPNPVKSTATATPASSLRIDAANAGVWGDDVDVVVAVTGSTFTLEVKAGGVSVEKSPALADTAEAVSWSQGSAYIRAVALGTVDPAAQTLALAGGTDDRSNVTAAEITAALAKFGAGLGPGQVAAPGITAATTHSALLAHAEANKRVALIDFADTSLITDVVTAATGLYDDDGNTFAGGFWPWDTAPGDSPGTTRTVPPSARNAALFARSVRETGGEVGQPPAGGRYPARFVTGLSRGVTDADRELLNDSGVNVSIVRRGAVLTYGNRTLTSAVTNPIWAQLNQSRVIAALASEAGEIGADYVHSKVDGQGLTLGEFAGRLQGLCAQYWRRGDLYGLEAEDSFEVTTEVDFEGGGAIILATIDATVSPGADRVRITIYKNPIS
jgi:phage tail sheath protein FI